MHIILVIREIHIKPQCDTIIHRKKSHFLSDCQFCCRQPCSFFSLVFDLVHLAKRPPGPFGKWSQMAGFPRPKP